MERDTKCYVQISHKYHKMPIQTIFFSHLRQSYTNGGFHLVSKTISCTFNVLFILFVVCVCVLSDFIHISNTSSQLYFAVNRAYIKMQSVNIPLKTVDPTLKNQTDPSVTHGAYIRHIHRLPFILSATCKLLVRLLLYISLAFRLSSMTCRKNISKQTCY